MLRRRESDGLSLVRCSARKSQRGPAGHIHVPQACLLEAKPIHGEGPERKGYPEH